MLTPDEHDLLLAYLARELPAEQVAALEARIKAEPAFADALVVLAREESILTEWAHSGAGGLVETAPQADVSTPAVRLPVTRKRRLMLAVRWGTAAAAIALVVWGVFHLTGNNDKRQSSELVVVESAQGDVTLETADGNVAVANGQQVQPGQVVRTGGDDSGAVLRYPDDTRLYLAAGTMVRVLRPEVEKGEAGKRIYVDEGQLTAQVSRQPMLLATHHAEVRSAAGRFSCSSSPAATRVEPQVGQVRFTRTSDGTSIEVHTGFYAVATDLPAGVEEPFTPRTLTAPLTVPRTTLPEGTGPVLAMAFSPDGHTLVTGGNDGILKFWDPSTGTLRLSFKAHSGVIKHLEYSRDGRWLLTSGNDRRTKVFDAETGQEKLALRKQRVDLDGAAFSPDARIIATVYSNNKEGGEVRFWQATTGQELGVLRVAQTQILTLDWSADGATIALGCRDGSVHLWQVTTGDKVTAMEQPVLSGHAGEVRSVAFVFHGGLVASAGVDGTARLWRVADGRELRVLTAHAREVRSVAFSADGRFLVTAGNDSAARLWNVADGREILTVKVRKGGITRALLSPDDGKTLVTAGMDRMVRLWNLEQERRVAAEPYQPRQLAVARR